MSCCYVPPSGGVKHCSAQTGMSPEAVLNKAQSELAAQKAGEV